MAHPKTIVITGASGGIGEALARTLSPENLVLAARRGDELQRVANGIGGNARAIVTDVTRRADIERLKNEAIRLFGSIDVWVNNAGRGITRPALELTDGDFDDMMTVNVKSALYGMQAVAPYFIERGRGHIINISSFLGRVPLATHRSAYNAAKAALNALTANVRVDLAKYPGIRVSLVMPGLVSTDFAKNAAGGAAGGPPPWVSGRSALPPGAMTVQTAEEVARIVAGLIDEPRAEIYTNPASAAMAKKYFDDVEAFEANLRPAQ